MSAPAVSVVMSVYNGEAWVGAAIESILKQSMEDFEFFAIDDGSTDDTGKIIESFMDERLWTASSDRLGLTSQLIRGIRMSSATLIARLDADDEAMPERLERQCEYLTRRPHVGLVGGAAYEVDGSYADPVPYLPMPENDAAIRRALIRENPFIHSSVMFRRSVYDQVGGYDPTVAVGQDYDLWMRMARVTKLANLPEPLVIRRRHPGQISVTRARERRLTEARVRWRAVRQGQYPWWCAAYALKPLLGSLSCGS